MKSITAFIAIAALVSAQNPVPIPGFNNISSLNGNWYVVWTFDTIVNDPPGFEFSCYTWDIDVGSDGGHINAVINYRRTEEHYTIHIDEIGTPNSIWDNLYYWVAVDPVAQSWATVGVLGNSYTSNIEYGYILSRSPTLNNLVLNASIALLQAEQFNISPTNQYYSTNANCPANCHLR